MPYGLGLRLPEGELRRRARARIDDGRLPRMFSRIFRPQYGSDEMCELCDQCIDRYRVDQVTDPRDGDVLAFHLVCYKLWQLECSGVSSVISSV